MSYLSTNGDNHTLSGLYFNDDTQNYVGLFGFATGSSAKVYDLGIVDSYFKANQYVGGVCGNVYSGSTVSNCYNTGTVTGAKDVGGVCGHLEYNGTVSNCYNEGTVSGNSDVGGVCGGNQGYGPGTILNCYNTGAVSGSSDVGKVCGDSDGTVSNCYYLADADDNSGGKTQAQFSSGEVAYFLSQGENASWGQNIDNGEDQQLFPVLDGAKVYRICDSGAITYTNDDTKVNNHNFDSHDGICACGEGRPAVYDEGSGYYKIKDSGNLYWFASLVNGTLDGTDRDSDANAKLMNNITVNTGDVAGCNGKKGEGWFDWTPIGKDTTTPYQGKFNGDGYTVSGLYFNNITKDYVGLFGYVSGSNANISNLGIEDSYFKANQYVGGVCGYNNYGTITDCHNEGAVSSTCYGADSADIGGVCGHLEYNGTVSNCYNEGTVSGPDDYIGGVCGQNNGGTVSDCYSTGAVSSTNSGSPKVGGVCGNNWSSTIANCYSKGTVGGTSYAIGVCGTEYNDSIIENCYYLAETEDENGGKTASQFNSGEVAYLLSQGCTIGDGESAVNYDGSVWGQNIDNGETPDAYPVLGGATVKYVDVYGQCVNNAGESTGKQYSNKDAVYVDHTDNDGDCLCDYCESVVESSLKVSATMVKGVSIRLTDENGLRFYTTVDSAKIAELQTLGATVELGTLIAPKDLLGDDDLTFDSSKYIDVKYEATYENGSYYWHNNEEGKIAGSIVNIKESGTDFNTEAGNITRNFVGRGYVKVTYNGTTVITYANYADGDIANNTRSLAYVADVYMNAENSEYNSKSDEIKALVQKWASKLTNK